MRVKNRSAFKPRATGSYKIAAGKKDWRIDAGYLELASKSKRARDDNGHFVPDDPATPDVNEAFEPEPEPAPKKAGGK